MNFPHAFPCSPALASSDIAALATALSCFLAGSLIFAWGIHCGQRGRVAIPQLPRIPNPFAKSAAEEPPAEKRKPPTIGI